MCITQLYATRAIGPLHAVHNIPTIQFFAIMALEYYSLLVASFCFSDFVSTSSDIMTTYEMPDYNPWPQIIKYNNVNA